MTVSPSACEFFFRIGVVGGISLFRIHCVTLQLPRKTMTELRRK